MKKILIIGPANSVFIYEFIKHILKDEQGVAIANVQFNSIKVPDEYIRYYENHNIKIFDCTLKDTKKNHKFNAGKSMIRAIFKTLFYSQKADIIHIHSLNWSSILLALLPKTKKIIVTIYGSDLLRASKTRLYLYKPVLKKCQFITMETGYLIESFRRHFVTRYDGKIRQTGFGSEMVDLLYDSKECLDKISAKKGLGIPTDKVSVFIGYNGRSGQQHINTIRQLADLPASVKEKICIFLHCSYGLSGEYHNQLRDEIHNSGIIGIINTDYLRGEGLKELRIAADIFLNMQITDVLSSSLLEFMVARAVIIQGKWLKYYELEDTAEITIIENFTQLNTIIIKYLSNPEEFYKRTEKNIEVAYQLLSWRKKKNGWMELFETF